MKNNQTAQKSNRNLIFAVMCLSIIVALLVVCVVLLLLKGNDTTPGSNSEENTEKENVATITVNTPYCEMKYPAEFSENLEIKEFNENGIYTKQFWCTLSNSQYKLFAVHFGEGAGGDFFGYLTNGNEKISVYLECYNSSDPNTLSDEEQRTYYYMMDSINEIARSISENPGYSAYQ